MIIYYDSFQEALWFQSLHPELQTALLAPFPGRANDILAAVLAYDRPDIVLVHAQEPILVVERTVEVPSGHNVGQRFARLVAAAQNRVPVVYFGPYAAYKHGGATQGPRYMNLRLFHALDEMATIEETAITVINWPVDDKHEVVQDPSKDERIKEYLELFFKHFRDGGLSRAREAICNSEFARRQRRERDQFIKDFVVKPEQYDSPPTSVQIGRLNSVPTLVKHGPRNLVTREVVLYNVGMTYIRADPYAGMAMLYAYLYCGGLESRYRNLVLHFPNISTSMWRDVTRRGRNRKDIKLFSLVSDGILFADHYLQKRELL